MFIEKVFFYLPNDFGVEWEWNGMKMRIFLGERISNK